MSYTVTTSYVAPLKKKNPSNPLEVTKKKKTLKPIVNPIFEQCAGLTEDKFWIAIFFDAARGKFPRGFSFKNGLLVHRKANKSSKLEVSDSPSEAFTTTIEFFQKVGGIMSAADRKEFQKNEEERYLLKMNDTVNCTWRDIKTEKLKDILINEFISEVATKLNFNEDEKKNLSTTIKKGLMLKCFTYHNIVMEEGRIIEIDGLNYNQLTREHEIDESYIPKRMPKKVQGLGLHEEEEKSKINFMEIWVKFLEQLEAKRVKKGFISTSHNSHNSQTQDDMSMDTAETMDNISNSYSSTL